MPNLPDNRPLLYLISDRRALRPNPETAEIPDEEARLLQIAIIRQAVEAGCRLIQIREKDLRSRELADLTREAIRVARPSQAKVLVNDRLDLALATGADGVHLRVSSMPASEARAAVIDRGLNDFLIGVSTHSLAEARTAEAGGADFIVCGPVYETLSKKDYGPPLGIERLAEICRSVNIPALALGGIDLTNYREPLQRGAAGIAGISLFTDQANLKHNIETILKK